MYSASPELTVAICLDRETCFEVADLQIPPMSIGGLRLFGEIGPGLDDWGLWGKLPERQVGSHFSYATQAWPLPVPRRPSTRAGWNRPLTRPA